MSWFKKLHWSWKVLIWFFVVALYFNIGYWFNEWHNYVCSYYQYYGNYTHRSLGSYIMSKPLELNGFPCYPGPEITSVVQQFVVDLFLPIMLPIALTLGWLWLLLEYSFLFLWWFAFQGGMFKVVLDHWKWFVAALALIIFFWYVVAKEVKRFRK